MSEFESSNSSNKAEPQFNEAHIQYAYGQLRSEQNIMMGLTMGAVAALIGAALWALITVLTEYQIGWMAVGIGFLVGYSIRTFGKGIDKIYGVIGAALALIGCGLGNLFAVCGVVAAEYDIGLFEVIFGLDFEIIKDIMVETSNPIDILFYGIAVYEGYKLSFRKLAEKDINSLITGSPQTG